MAKSIQGILVKRETTSKDTNNSSSASFTSYKIRKFEGIFDSGELMNETIGLKGIPVLWIFGKP